MRIVTEGEVRITNARVANNGDSQLNRVEKKVDRILELLEGQELSTLVRMDGKVLANTIYPSVVDL